MLQQEEEARTEGGVDFAALVVVGGGLFVGDVVGEQRAEQIADDAVRVAARVHAQSPSPFRHHALSWR